MKGDRISPLDRIADHFSSRLPSKVGVAVSGGSDSLALLVLMIRWAAPHGVKVRAVTVNHNIRPEAVQEAEHVEATCRGMRCPHDTIQWGGPLGAGNLLNQAREARYALIADWAASRKIHDVALGHTLNDQAETFLMRLAREAGVDGLSSMSGRWERNGCTFHRPLLKVARGELRRLLVDHGIVWCDDPGNDNVAFERTRARRVLEALEPLGITAGNLAAVSDKIDDVRRHLYAEVLDASIRMVKFEMGDAVVNMDDYRTLNREVARRLLQNILKWIGGGEHAPRGRAVEAMLNAIENGVSMTLGGCYAMVDSNGVRFTREARAVSGKSSAPGEIWDGRWKVEGPWPDGAKVEMLGKTGLLECGERGESGMPEASLLSSPAIWCKGELVAAPLALKSDVWTAQLTRDERIFFFSLLSH
ncbi:MAG: tRNA lysidine(34) synthetase TilS [Roseovarius sp.]|nr:tRNA lysidine(34) synthetase TilS [Roseovarius sp.]